MKRTEKVEIRVSLEEKETLAALAKQEGESVSGLLRGLVEKYMALNTASAIRKLPKWQIVAGLTLAAFIGHGLTLIPMHLHDRVHQSALEKTPVFYVHGVIDQDAFGIGLQAGDAEKSITLNRNSEAPTIVRLSFEPLPKESGTLRILICETVIPDSCETEFQGEMFVDHSGPSVLGNRTKSGKPIHIFVQEVA